jgi:hypothetical protein
MKKILAIAVLGLMVAPFSAFAADAPKHSDHRTNPEHHTTTGTPAPGTGDAKVTPAKPATPAAPAAHEHSKPEVHKRK